MKKPVNTPVLRMRHGKILCTKVAKDAVKDILKILFYFRVSVYRVRATRNFQMNSYFKRTG